MFSIKRAVELTGIPAGTLRAWESRYGVGTSQRTDSGYRVYDQEAISEILRMKSLVAAGWTHPEAAKEVLAKSSGTTGSDPRTMHEPLTAQPDLSQEFLDAARALDEEKLSSILDLVFSRASFESVFDSWLIPTLRTLGNEWVAGRMDIASEHFASNAIMRRLGIALEASSLNVSSQKVIIGTPQGSFHEIGALALSIALRRRGLAVIYLGNNVPAEVWVDAVRRNPGASVVIPVVMESDVAVAQSTVNALAAANNKLIVAVGGANASKVQNATIVLTGGLVDATQQLTSLIH